jgi:hypothetical protein
VPVFGSRRRTHQACLIKKKVFSISQSSTMACGERQGEHRKDPAGATKSAAGEGEVDTPTPIRRRSGAGSRHNITKMRT